MPGEYDELYAVAREVLLDALEALGAHRSSIVLAGAQAIYLRTGEADLAVAPYTTDGDLVVDPSVLGKIPPLERALGGAGFVPDSASSVGIWKTSRPTTAGNTVVAVDLLVPSSVSPGKGRRDARLEGHAPRTARIVNGLEGALIDHDEMVITALNDSDARKLRLRVAGPAGLLVAKAFKIHERKDGVDRLRDKDALDVLRLLRGTELDELIERFQRLLADELSGTVTTQGISHLGELFRDAKALGAQMAARAVGTLEDAEEIAASCAALTDDLLAEIG